MTKLREIRLAQGLTQFELAKRSNVYPADISKIEAGIVRPYEKWRKALALALNVPEEALFPEVAKNANKAK